MLAKIVPAITIALFCLNSTNTNVFAQISNDVYDSTSVYKASFSQDDEDEDPTEALKEQIKRMELRLRELEDDVENKLDAEAESEGETEKDKEEYDFDKRIAELEKSYEKQDETITKIDDGLEGMLFHSHKTPRLNFYGRIHLDFWGFPDVDETLDPVEENPEDRFNFRRLRIGIKGDLNDRMFYKYEGEFAGGNNPSYRDAFLGFKSVPYLQTVIIGNHKRPYGLDHLNSSRHNVTIERPFIVEAFNQDSRRLGISANGNTEDENWNWRFGVWNQQLTQNTDGFVGDHYQLEFAARIARTPWYDESSGGRGYAHFAIAGSVGALDGGQDNNPATQFRTRPEARSDNRWLDTGQIPGAEETALIGLESVINVGAFQFTGEYLRNNVNRDNTLGEDVAFDGGYVQTSYLLTGEHHPWNRKTGTLGRLKPFENFFLVRDVDGNMQRGLGAWEVYSRYSWADLEDFDILGGTGDSWTFGFNWYLNPYSRVQFTYLNGEIENGPNGAFGDYQILGGRIMVDF